MRYKGHLVLAVGLFLVACASDQPRVIQASTDAKQLQLSRGTATQIEMPDKGRVQTVTVGNAALVTAEQGTDVVNLTAHGDVGQTNLIIRSRDEDNHTKVYQYNVTVQ